MFELTITMLHNTCPHSACVMITYNKEKYITRIFIESLLFQSSQVDQTNSFVYLYLIQLLFIWLIYLLFLLWFTISLYHYNCSYICLHFTLLVLFTYFSISYPKVGFEPNFLHRKILVLVKKFPLTKISFPKKNNTINTTKISCLQQF